MHLDLKQARLVYLGNSSGLDLGEDPRQGITAISLEECEHGREMQRALLPLQDSISFPQHFPFPLIKLTWLAHKYSFDPFSPCFPSFLDLSILLPSPFIP